MVPARTTAALGLLFALLATGPALGQADAGTPVIGRDTLKTRLGDKASDKQRVNDCKVPPEKRAGSRRPTACARPEAPPPR